MRKLHYFNTYYTHTQNKNIYIFEIDSVGLVIPNYKQYLVKLGPRIYLFLIINKTFYLREGERERETNI